MLRLCSFFCLSIRKIWLLSKR